MNRHTLQRLTRLGTQAGLAMAVAAALTLPTRADAGSFQLPTDNAAGWARANAGGSLFPDDPTAAYNNPAAMAFFDAPMLQLTGTGIRPSSQFHGQFSDVDGHPVSGGNPNGFGKFVPFPDIAFVLPVNDRLTLGGSVTVPYGLASEYNPTWEGRYFGTKTSLQSVAISFSAGFKVNDEFAIGAGIEGQRTKAQLNTVLDTTGAANALFNIPLPPQTADEQLNVTVKKRFAFGYFGGFVFKPTSQDTLGFSYHSRVQQTLSGTYNLYGGATGKQLLTLAPVLDPSLPTINPNGGPASASLNTPAFASLDWLHMFTDRFTLAGSVKWTDWSSFQSLVLTSNGQQLVSLTQGYKDTYTASVGGDYKLTDQWTLRAGVGYDETPTNIISRDPRIPDQSRKLLGVGAGYKATEHLAFDLGYQHQFVNHAPVNMTNSPILGAGTMTGYFDDSGDVVSLTGTYKF